MRAIVDAAGGRVPVFVGTTCLNTRDTIALTREALALGAAGTMLGIPMWCAPALDVSVQFYSDVAEAVPEMNIAIYANPEAFKFDFPRAFWAPEIGRSSCWKRDCKYLYTLGVAVSLKK